MAIKQILENALKTIEGEKERAIATAREKATRESVIPNNAKVDSAKTAAIAELNEKLNQKIAALQNEFNASKQQIVEASEKSKSDFATATLETAASMVSLHYDKAITDLKKQISEIKE